MKAHWTYLKYVARHKWFVFLAGLLTGAPLWRLVIHDWSKLTPAEWTPYVQYFYGRCRDCTAYDKKRVLSGSDYARDCTINGPAVAAAFDRAWLHHQHVSPHHWQHWVLREDSGKTKALEMPKPLVREMVADWMGAGRAITGKIEVASWYGLNGGNMVLHPMTRALVEQIIAEVTAPGMLEDLT